MKKSIDYLPTEKQMELKKIVSLLRKVDEKAIDKIILYGSYARGDYKLKRGKTQGKKSDFDILIIVDTDESKEKVRLAIGNTFFAEIETSVQAIVETIGDVNFCLLQSQFFFSDIVKEGVCLYDGKYYEFATPKVLSGAERKKMAEEDFEEWFSQAICSWEDFENNFSKIKKLPIYYQRSAFHLQQTVEMCYTTIEMVFTHYNPYEHKLSILRERIEEFDPRVLQILPTRNEEEKELFEYLDFAYIGGRYKSKEEFPVSKEQLDYWSTEAKKLLAFTEKICKEQITRFGEGDFFNLRKD